MKIFAPSALLLAISGWALTVFLGGILLSGKAAEERACQTDCVQQLFFSGLGIGVVALTLAVMALVRASTRKLVAYGALIFAAPLFAIYAGIIVIGNLA